MRRCETNDDINKSWQKILFKRTEKEEDSRLQFRLEASPEGVILIYTVPLKTVMKIHYACKSSSLFFLSSQTTTIQFSFYFILFISFPICLLKRCLHSKYSIDYCICYYLFLISNFIQQFAILEWKKETQNKLRIYFSFIQWFWNSSENRHEIEVFNVDECCVSPLAWNHIVLARVCVYWFNFISINIM